LDEEPSGDGAGDEGRRHTPGRHHPAPRLGRIDPRSFGLRRRGWRRRDRNAADHPAINRLGEIGRHVAATAFGLEEGPGRFVERRQLFVRAHDGPRSRDRYRLIATANSSRARRSRE